MDDMTIAAIIKAINNGFDVEISRGKYGELKVKTVQKKNLKTR